MVLLNNDLTIGKGFIAASLAAFRPRVMSSLSPRRAMTGRGLGLRVVRPGLAFRHGFYSWVFEKERQELSHTLFTSGGFMAVDREKFLALGGFNDLLYPAYCEDLDLCFRAWRKGWRCIYEPASVVNHREHGSWSNGKMGRPERLNLRNSLLFQWSTLPMTRARFQRAKTTFKCMLRGLLRGDASVDGCLVRDAAALVEGEAALCSPESQRIRAGGYPEPNCSTVPLFLASQYECSAPYT